MSPLRIDFSHQSTVTHSIINTHSAQRDLSKIRAPAAQASHPRRRCGRRWEEMRKRDVPVVDISASWFLCGTTVRTLC